MANREHRRAAEKQGVSLPIIEIRLFENGQVVIDKHGDITDEQVEGFVENILAKIRTEKLIRDG